VSAARVATFANDGLTFSATDTGPIDGPVVLLLHGFPQTSRAWGPVSVQLNAHGFRTVAPDLRGYAPDARPRGRINYRSSKVIGDVVALIDAIGAGPVHLIGHDWGALLAWSTANAHPEVVTTLTAVSVPHYAAFLRSALSSNQLRRSYYIAMFQLPVVPEMLFRIFPKSLARALAKSGMNVASIAHVQHDVVDSGALTPAINWYRGLLASNQRLMLRATTVPTTFVWGDADTLLGRRGAELTATYVTGPYRLDVLPGISHWIPDEAPQALVESFLRSAG
jgi:pimeloyl-ACP methyl ester carboxylesterase